MREDFAELLEGLTEAERPSRLALLERLHADGCTLDELRAAHATGRLPLLPVERMLARRRRHSLTDAARAAGITDTYAEDLPPVHAGVAHGPALQSAGDWLGRTVNVAARLCAVAPPWTVLATGEAAADSHDWEPAGLHDLRGIAEPVAALRALRRASE